MKTRFTKLVQDLSIRGRDTLNSTETGAEMGCDSLNSSRLVSQSCSGEMILWRKVSGEVDFGLNHLRLGTGERKSILTRQPMQRREFSKAHLHLLSEAVYGIVGRDSSKFAKGTLR